MIELTTIQYTECTENPPLDLPTDQETEGYPGIEQTMLDEIVKRIWEVLHERK